MLQLIEYLLNFITLLSKIQIAHFFALFVKNF